MCVSVMKALSKTRMGTKQYKMTCGVMSYHDLRFSSKAFRRFSMSSPVSAPRTMRITV